jgi:pimeloyl-ACP methyl ester carboxylesterase
MLGMTDAEAMRPFAIGNRLSTVKIPVLGIWGKQDPRGDYEGAVEKLSSMPNVQLEAIDQCGHLPHLEQSERFLKILRAFLYRK